MSWRNKEDLGTQLVAHVYESLRIPQDYVVDQPRGFTWWAGDQAQSIWCDLGNFHNANTLYRLHADIEFLKGCGHAHEAQIALTELMGQGTLSAIVYDEAKDLYKLHCSVYANYDNEAWIKRVFNAAVALQCCEVNKHAHKLAKEFKLAPAISEHPRVGMRKTQDPICCFEEQFFKPHGAIPSRWIGSQEWEDGYQAIKRISTRVNTDNRACLEGEFTWDFGPRDMQLVVSAEDPHPELGSGLMFNLVIPVGEMDRETQAHLELKLNELERKEWNWCHDLGSWCTHKGELAFTCFVPNICFTPGILAEMSHDMGLRAKWINENWGQAIKREWILGVETLGA